LHTIKVYDDPEASSVLANRRKAKVARLQAAGKPATESATTSMSADGDQTVVNVSDLQEEASVSALA
jgi:hypothetical protein